MHVVKYLSQFGAIEAGLSALKTEYGISARLYPEDDIVLLDYSQIDSPKMHPITIECRSLILRMSDLSVVSRAFDRFFNAGECPEYYSDFDASRANVYEKADGSLVKVYWHPTKEQWCISTRGTAYAEGNHALGGAFLDHILKAFTHPNDRCDDPYTMADFQEFFGLFIKYGGGGCEFNLVSEFTWVFEFTSPTNRIVTRYDAPVMVLLDIVHNETGKSLIAKSPELFALLVEEFNDWWLNVRAPKVYEAGDVETLIKRANELDNLAEGFVLYDPVSGKRMKIKSSAYVAAHRLRGEDMIPSRKRVLECILTGEQDEILAVFPEFKQYFDEYGAEVVDLKESVVSTWERLSGIPDQKEFAITLNSLPITQGAKGLVFNARSTTGCPLKSFDALPLTQKLKIFTKRNEYAS